MSGPTAVPGQPVDVPLVLGQRTFRSRLIVGTGKYRSNEEMVACHEASGADMVTFDAAALAAEPGPVRRRLLLTALRDVAGMREVALEHVEAAADILRGSSSGADLPGARLELRRGKLVLLRKRPRDAPAGRD